MGTILKHTARLFGLDASHYSCHSLRVGGATHQTDGEILLMGRWRSMPACLGYQAPSTATHDRLLALLEKGGKFTNRDVLLSQVHRGA